ncbi:transposase [Streptomyces canus]|uniref:transposase n=1 Tax=Streptomyces canus TaxID=58343 RepID=UPI0033C93322
MLDAIRCLVDNGVKWRAMPVDFPPSDRVYAFFRRWRDHALVKEFHDRLRARVRRRLGRDAEPTAGVIDSQSVKADAVVGADSRGFDGGKQINGRKRHVVVDTLGLLLGVMVTSAHVGERATAQVLLHQVAAAHHLLALVRADGGYTGSLVEYCLATLALVLAIVKRSDDMRGFVAAVTARHLHPVVPHQDPRHLFRHTVANSPGAPAGSRRLRLGAAHQGQGPRPRSRALSLVRWRITAPRTRSGHPLPGGRPCRAGTWSPRRPRRRR